MNQSTKPGYRRTAVVGATIALVATAGVLGFGATAATAATASPSPTPTGTSTPAVSTPGSAPAATSAPAASTPVTWSEPSTPQHPIILTVTAGEPFSHTFVANGGDGPLEYLFNPLAGADGFTWDEQTGVLSGTLTSATSYPFDVTATDLHQSAVQHVVVEVQPAAPVQVVADVVSGPNGEAPGWLLKDGTITAHQGDATVSTIPAEQGQSVWIDSTPVDRFGNPLYGPEQGGKPAITSSVASDEFAWDATRALWRVTFTHASPHVVTLTYGDVTGVLRFAVAAATTPVATPTPAPTPTAVAAATGTATGSGTDTLAYTGADDTGLLAWALGLLAAGGGLLVWRLRRRA
ncbi:hypothetical protein EDF24_2914 [Curtobacterium sp. PhB130]|uniref:hypothetical protein n=1 Tax=Curtobacterium sp. PhB130 TaxID=2485178 RepID=UPI000F4CFA03|nr:hypothetical protein [Curtobacterium sp. PhB130]ROS73907.1 hypothetical protein EDF24_2914 [Curtobacterium sp. PhB130]